MPDPSVTHTLYPSKDYMSLDISLSVTNKEDIHNSHESDRNYTFKGDITQSICVCARTWKREREREREREERGLNVTRCFSFYQPTKRIYTFHMKVTEITHLRKRILLNRSFCVCEREREKREVPIPEIHLCLKGVYLKQRLYGEIWTSILESILKSGSCQNVRLNAWKLNQRTTKHHDSQGKE